ncbi:gamma-glutamyltransferase, partial [Pseudomonas sp. 2822-15]|uniref:gamma-glutamyltransferase n=1 Tax=Pseudomonas sp. 2822-15 TaxID=1712677 RepID=UPI0015A77098
ISFRYRDEWITDKESINVPYDELLSEEHATKMNEFISMDRAFPIEELDSLPNITGSKDTTFMSAVDEDGNAVSLIQSIYHEFGSGFMP